MTDSPKILIVSQSHTAVDNILEGLSQNIREQTEIIRIGADKNISKEIAEKYTLGAHQKYLISEIEKNVQEYMQRKSALMDIYMMKEKSRSGV